MRHWAASRKVRHPFLEVRSVANAGPQVNFGEFENSGPRHDYREIHMLRFLSGVLPAPADILDAGCGNGSLGLRLAHAGYSVTGVDLASLQVGRALDKARNVAGQFRVVNGSLTALPFADASISGATSGEVLEHIQEDEAAIKEIGRVLKPGAPLIATVPFDPRKWDDSDDWHGHVRRYTKEDFTRLLAHGGFRVERTFVWGFPLLGIYHRHVYLPWVRRARHQSAQQQETSWIKRVASSGLVRGLLANVFRIDDLFAGLERGIGLLVVARRLGPGPTVKQ